MVLDWISEFKFGLNMETTVREDSGLFLVLDFLRNKGIML